MGLGVVGLEGRRPIKQRQRLVVAPELMQNPALVGMGLGIAGLKTEGRGKTGQRLLGTPQVVERKPEIVVHLGVVGGESGGAAQALGRRLVASQRRQRVAAIGVQPGMLGPQHQGAIEAGDRLDELPELAEPQPQILQGRGMGRMAGDDLTQTRHTLVDLPALQRDQAAQMGGVGVRGLLAQHLFVEGFGFRQPALLMKGEPLLEPRLATGCHTACCTSSLVSVGASVRPPRRQGTRRASG